VKDPDPTVVNEVNWIQETQYNPPSWRLNNAGRLNLTVKLHGLAKKFDCQEVRQVGDLLDSQ